MLIAVLAALSLYLLDSRTTLLDPARSMLSAAVYPLQKTASLPTDFKDWTLDFFQSRNALRERVKVLEASQLMYSARLQKLRALEQENMRLRELLGSSFRLNERIQVAELLNVDLDPFSQHVVIDKGERYGVYSGQPVLDASGVMGQVTEVTPLSSRVILLTDPSHSIPVQINRNGLRAVVTGRGMGKTLQMEHLPHHADVRVGDLLITSGLAGRFPFGYPVGKVVAVEHPDGQAFAEIAVEPAASLSTSREVMLVMQGEKLEFTNLLAPDL